MANEKLSQLPSGVSTLTVADLLYLVQSGASVSITIGDIPAAFALASAASPAAGTFTNLSVNVNITGGNRIEAADYIRTGAGILYFVSGAPNNPMLVSSGTTLQVLIGDMSAFAPVSLLTATFGNTTSLGNPTGASRIGSLNGVMSVINDGESAALPITRTVGVAAYTAGGSLGAQSSQGINLTVTGVLSTDTFVANLASPSGWGNSGGILIGSVSASGGIVSIIVVNTDALASMAIPNIQLTVFR